MGFIDAVRAWLFGADDDAEDAGESGDETTPSGGDEDGPNATDAAEPDGLDPAAATETRTASATDDAVDALRDVRRSQEAAESSEPGGGVQTGSSNEGDQRPPDDGRTKPADDGGTNG
ncbi:hypothetical protein SAMN04488067_106183 [Halorubrum xinjiangense]|uniref:Uncharacterized protein n=1 Tax=Halorubrum xinjiangense TaxID=261291 RepID=A0A1G7MRR3_9EURY|nr:hypothetical protein [Halorubrum xinjiangense]SDF64485.1 hypothetical protein SAMN04488067_106183 [Halorubrum xinjiangense]